MQDILERIIKNSKINHEEWRENLKMYSIGNEK